MTAFLDTNIIIDFYAEREQFYRPAAMLFDLAAQKKIEIAVSASTFINAFYILRHQYSKDALYASMKKLASICVIPTLDRSLIEQALNASWSDFEDCTQALSALTIAADVIITRNIRDFEQSAILVKDPISFLNDYFSQQKS